MFQVVLTICILLLLDEVICTEQTPSWWRAQLSLLCPWRLLPVCVGLSISDLCIIISLKFCQLSLLYFVALPHHIEEPLYPDVMSPLCQTISLLWNLLCLKLAQPRHAWLLDLTKACLCPLTFNLKGPSWWCLRLQRFPFTHWQSMLYLIPVTDSIAVHCVCCGFLFTYVHAQARTTKFITVMSLNTCLCAGPAKPWG